MHVLLRIIALAACLAASPVAFGDVPLAQRKTEWLGTPDLMRAMQNGGYVIYFRHGLTNWSEKLREQRNSATTDFNLANCASQRNLSEEGRSEARMIRFALAQMKIPVGRVYASQYCRPAEHVAIIAGRQPDERVFWLTGLGRPETMSRLRERVSTPPETGTNILLGDHGDLIYNITDWVIEEGDAVVFRPEPPGYEFIAWIRSREWLDLARKLEATDQPVPPNIIGFEIEGDIPIGIDAARAAVAPSPRERTRPIRGSGVRPIRCRCPRWLVRSRGTGRAPRHHSARSRASRNSPDPGISAACAIVIN